MRISPEVEIALSLAANEAARRRHEYITVEHLLYALLFDDATALVVKSSGGDLARLKKDLERFMDEQLEQVPVRVVEVDPRPAAEGVIRPPVGRVAGVVAEWQAAKWSWQSRRHS